MPAPPLAGKAAPELFAGQPVERELGPGETDAFTIPLAAGEYVRLLVRARPMDVALRLIGPGGEPVAEVDGPDGSKERELLSLVSAAAGSYRLLVERRDPGERRKYKLELQERRPARPDDEVRVRAERSFHDGLHALALGTAERLDRAVLRFEESLALWRSIEDQAGQADCWNNLGAVAYYRGERRAAAEKYEQALRLAESAGYLRGMGEALNNLGLTSAALGDHQATSEYYRRALAVWRQLDDSAETATTWHNLGLFHLERGEAEPARQALDEALGLRNAIGEVAGAAATLQALGALNLRLLETGAAVEQFSQALPLSRASGNLRLEAYLLSSLAAVHRQRGDLQQALQLYHEASERFEKLGDATSHSVVLEALGNLYLDVGDYGRATEQYERALRVYREQGNRNFEARVLSSIGLAMLRQGSPQEALAVYGQGLELSRELANRGAEITILHRRGMALHALGDRRAALADLEASLALQEATGTSWQKASVLGEIGVVLSDLGEESRALEHFVQAADLAKRREQPAVRCAVLLAWAELEIGRGRLEVARPMLEEALSIVESVRRGVVRQDLRETYSASRNRYYEAYVDLLMRLQEAHPEEAFAEAAFAASERSRARGMAELLAEGRIDVRRGIAGELREREIGIGVQISKVQAALFEERSGDTSDAAKVADLEEQLREVLEERERLEAEIRVRHPRYAEVRYPEPLALADLQRALDPETAFLEYALGPEVSYLFVVTAAGFDSFRLPGAREVERGVERFRRALARPDHRLMGQLQQSAYDLYWSLVAPAAELLNGYDKWIIAPDGALHLLPFEALLTKPPGAGGGGLRDGSFLVREHAVVYVPSAGVLRGLRASSSTADAGGAVVPSKFVAFAAPLYGGGKSPTSAGSVRETRPVLPDLPETRREAESIARLYPPGEVALYLGADATEENVKAEEISSARRIHFAVHGHLDERRPELSGLVLSRPSDSAEDGILQAYEIFNLDLRADLVVLSACETGLGKQLAGEGLVGLSRAFFYAGTPTLVVSLWRVADASTADIMIEFHRRLNRGEDKAKALRGAKLEALDSTRLSHPFHWASFVVVGDG